MDEAATNDIAAAILRNRDTGEGIQRDELGVPIVGGCGYYVARAIHLAGGLGADALHTDPLYDSVMALDSSLWVGPNLVAYVNSTGTNNVTAAVVRLTRMRVKVSDCWTVYSTLLALAPALSLEGLTLTDDLYWLKGIGLVRS